MTIVQMIVSLICTNYLIFIIYTEIILKVIVIMTNLKHRQPYQLKDI